MANGASEVLLTMRSTYVEIWSIRILMLLSLVFIFFSVHDFAWARKKLSHRHSLMIGAGFFGELKDFGDEGLVFEYQYDLSERISISFKPALAFPETANSYYAQFLPGINWRPLGGVLPQRRNRSFNLSPYLALSAGLDYFWTDPVANNIETQRRFGLLPCVGLGFTTLLFSHILGDINSSIGLSWRLFGEYDDTFAVQQHFRIAIGMKF